MDTGRRVHGDDVCDTACPSGPPPTCPKMACHRAITMFERDMMLKESEKKENPSHKPRKIK